MNITNKQVNEIYASFGQELDDLQQKIKHEGLSLYEIACAR